MQEECYMPHKLSNESPEKNRAKTLPNHTEVVEEVYIKNFSLSLQEFMKKAILYAPFALGYTYMCLFLYTVSYWGVMGINIFNLGKVTDAMTSTGISHVYGIVALTFSITTTLFLLDKLLHIKIGANGKINLLDFLVNYIKQHTYNKLAIPKFTSLFVVRTWSNLLFFYLKKIYGYLVNFLLFSIAILLSVMLSVFILILFIYIVEKIYNDKYYTLMSLYNILFLHMGLKFYLLPISIINVVALIIYYGSFFSPAKRIAQRNVGVVRVNCLLLTILCSCIAIGYINASHIITYGSFTKDIRANIDVNSNILSTIYLGSISDKSLFFSPENDQIYICKDITKNCSPIYKWPAKNDQLKQLVLPI
jgi:hypothetical protein